MYTLRHITTIHRPNAARPETRTNEAHDCMISGDIRNQIDRVWDARRYRTDHLVMDAARLYESPFTDVAASGPEELFPEGRVETWVARLESIRQAAIAA